MGVHAFSVNTRFDTIECYKCNCIFAVTSNFNRRNLEDGSSFYCPNGHSQSYSTTEVTRLKRKLEEAEDSKAWIMRRLNKEQDKLSAERRSKAAIKGVLTKAKNRIKNGVCPCCNRTFNNLHRHMQSKHPDYK